MTGLDPVHSASAPGRPRMPESCAGNGRIRQRKARGENVAHVWRESTAELRAAPPQLGLARTAQELPGRAPGRCCTPPRRRGGAPWRCIRPDRASVRTRCRPSVPGVLAAALDASAEATVLLDAQGCCVYVNPAACAVLGTSADALLGRPSPFAADDDGGRGPAARYGGQLRDPRVNDTSSIAGAPSTTADGRRLTVVTFRDVTDVRVQRRASPPSPPPPRTSPTPARCAPPWTRSAPSSWRPRTSRARRSSSSTRPARGCGCTAPRPSTGGRPTSPSGSRRPVGGARRLHSFEALRAGRPVVTHGRKAQMLADPRWAPLHDQLDSFEWEDFAAVPLVAHERVVGALNAYYATRVRARRRRDRLPHGDGRPGRRRGGERPAGRRGARRGGPGRAPPARARAARLRMSAAVLDDPAHPRRGADVARRARRTRCSTPSTSSRTRPSTTCAL